MPEPHRQGRMSATRIPGKPIARMFRRPVLLAVLLILGLLVAGLLAVGAFPPGVKQQPVERVLPNDRFVPR